jgi:hypothetical protein
MVRKTTKTAEDMRVERERRKTQEAMKGSLRKSDIKVMFTCAYCHTENPLTLDDLSFYYSEQDCECCGSHGCKDINFSCVHCGQYFEISESW